MEGPAQSCNIAGVGIHIVYLNAKCPCSLEISLPQNDILNIELNRLACKSLDLGI